MEGKAMTTIWPLSPGVPMEIPSFHQDIEPAEKLPQLSLNKEDDLPFYLTISPPQLVKFLVFVLCYFSLLTKSDNLYRYILIFGLWM